MNKRWLTTLVLGLSLAQLGTLIEANASLAARTFACKYTYEGMPFADVAIGVSDDLHLDSTVAVSAWGQSHRESAETMACGTGELFHIVIAKENPENTIYMIIYTKTLDAPLLSDNIYKSDLINPHMPQIGQKVGGTCTLQ
jgi:hypothetical protein